MTKKEILDEWLLYTDQTHLKEGHYQVIENAMKEYTKLKCQELLEIVTKQAKIVDEDGDVYQQPHVLYCNGEEYKTWIDKESILNCVNLDEFIE